MKKLLSIFLSLILIIVLVLIVSNIDTEKTSQMENNISNFEESLPDPETKNDFDEKSDPTQEQNDDLDESSNFIQEQKNGYNEKNNSFVKVGNFYFSIPSYWISDINESDQYRAYAETSGKLAMLYIKANEDKDDPVTYDILKEETDNGLMMKAVEAFFDKCECKTSEEYDNGKVKGFIYKANYTQVIDDSEYDGQCTVFCFPSESDNKWVWVNLSQTNNTTYRYDDDFLKVLGSINNTLPKDMQLSYSTNDLKTAKEGNKGVYAYASKGLETDAYYIIDFDEGYVYSFSDRNGEETCWKTKITEGNLNERLIITHHESSYTWIENLHFKWQRVPDHLMVQIDYNPWESDFYTTDLEEALKIRDTKPIKED